MFLTVDDYRPVCDQYEFEQITQNEDIRLAAEAAAVEQISSYLRNRYDTDRLFSAVFVPQPYGRAVCGKYIAVADDTPATAEHGA